LLAAGFNHGQDALNKPAAVWTSPGLVESANDIELLFERLWAEIVESRVQPLSIVEPLNVLEDGRARLGPSRKGCEAHSVLSVAKKLSFMALS
jgi:hypothetical protein